MDFKKVYTRIFSSVGNYCCDGIDLSEPKHDWLVNIASTYKPTSVVDIGSGKGTMLSFFKDTNVDILAADLSNFLKFDFPFKEINLMEELILDKQYDLLICCDVIEHLPLPKSVEVLSKIKPYGKLFFIGIANHSDRHSDPEGLELHLTQENKQFWDKEISSLFKIIKSDSFRQDQLFLYLLESK